MTKLIWLLVLATLACRLLTGKWPWRWLSRGSGRSEAIAGARRLLGVSVGATRQEITEAHRRLVARVHPDRGGTEAGMHEANDARDLLLNNLPTDS